VIVRPSECGSDSTLYFVDRATIQADAIGPWAVRTTIPPVNLPGCYLGGLVLSDGTVLLGRIQPRTRDVIRYDWKTARTVRVYPDLTLPSDSLLSRDGRWLYTLEYGDGAELTYTDLDTGKRVARFHLGVENFGFARTMALSPDGQTLYVNINFGGVATFDALKPAEGPRLIFEGMTASQVTWPFSLVIDTEAKSTFGTDIVVDPQGRWVALLAEADVRSRGIWIVNAKGVPRVSRNVHPRDSFRSLAASLDGSALYALEAAESGRYLLVLDPNTGKDLKEFTVRQSADPPKNSGGFDGIAWVEPSQGG
jgi:DNA-binding beta-propeller fold protein YncE